MNVTSKSELVNSDLMSHQQLGHTEMGPRPKVSPERSKKRKIDLSIPGPEVIKLSSCSTQLNMKIFVLLNIKMPTIFGILTFMSGKNSI